MAIYASNSGGDFKPAPAGNHVAICYSMVQLGTIESEYMGEKKWVPTVRLSWELPHELNDDGKPFSFSKEYSLFLSEKANLRKNLESWRGKPFTADEVAKFDITKLLGAPCMLSIVHKLSKDGTKTYASLGGIATLPKGMAAPSQVNDNFQFELDPFDKVKFDKLPDFIKTKIQGSKEYLALMNPGHDPEAEKDETTPAQIEPIEDDLPF